MEFNYDEALKNLDSSTQRDRFSAVKYFIKNKHPEIKHILIDKLTNEKVQHIKKALEKAIDILNNNEAMNIDESEINAFLEDTKDVKKYLKAKAIDEFSGIILHELEPKIGMLKTYLAAEINNYENSKSKEYIEEFEQFFIALENLRKSSAIAKFSEVNISKLINKIAEEEIKTDINIVFDGTENLIVKGDKHLLSFAIANGIRNAQESLSLLSENEQKKLMISWDKTDIDYWICIADEGIGLKSSPEEAFKLGNTSKNKKDHTGFGLSIISQSMNSLNGTADLSNNGVGAKLILRWTEVE